MAWYEFFPFGKKYKMWDEAEKDFREKLKEAKACKIGLEDAVTRLRMEREGRLKPQTEDESEQRDSSYNQDLDAVASG